MSVQNGKINSSHCCYQTSKYVRLDNLVQRGEEVAAHEKFRIFFTFPF